MKQLDANTLVAYVDGELDPESAALVELRLAEDEEAREIAVMLRQSASLVRAAHAHVLHEAVPDRLLDVFEMARTDDGMTGEIVPPHLVNMILDAPDEVSEPVAPARAVAAKEAGLVISIARRRSIAAFATAAVFAAVMVGGGMMFEKYRSVVDRDGISHQVRVATAIDDPWREAAFQEALESRKSDAALIWANPDNGRSGAIIPVKTYRREDGVYCREFRTVDTGAAPDYPNYGVACREQGKQGRWVKLGEAISAPGAGGKLKF